MGIKLSRSTYLNKKFQCNDGELFTVIEYFHSKNITIQFDDGTKMFKQKSVAINRGIIKNPNPLKFSNSLIPTIYGIGFVGIGKFTSDSNHSNYYHKWHEMFQKCYSKIYQLTSPTYIDCSVDPIWHNFQNFCEWCEDPINGYNKIFDIEKDILFKGNKIYGPKTCCFAPSEINMLFVKRKNSRGKYPIGVTLSGKKFKSHVKINGIQKYLGTYNTIEEAFQAYKEAKEKQIQWMALTWFKQKKLITEKVFNAMMEYQVEITD